MVTQKQLIIFDLDGTLVDSVPDLAFSVDEVLTQLGVDSAGEDKVRTWVGNGAEKLIERALIDANLPQDHKPQALAQFLASYNNHCAVKTVLYPGVREALSWFAEQSITMVIATNKPRRFIQPILQSLNIGNYFSAFIGGDDVQSKKPDPEQLLWCLSQTGIAAEQALMIGDSRNDIEAAHNAGIDVVAVSYGYNHGRSISEERVDRVVANLCELIET